MLKKLFLIFLVLISLIFSIGAASVEIKSNIYNEYSLFTYTFNFDIDENYKSFSFEKPKDAKIDYAIDELGNTIKIGFAGDYFIVEPEENTENKTFEIRYISTEVSQLILSSDSFSQYVNFNFPVNSLTFTLNFEDGIKEIEEIYPRYYQLNGNRLTWDLQNLESDTLFLVNFQKDQTRGILNISDSQKMYLLGWMVLILLLGILFYIYLIFIRKKLLINEKKSDSKQEIKTTKKTVKKKNKPSPKEIVKIPKKELSQEEKYKEFLKKYLTENEKDIVDIVRKQEGISQYDVLNFLPSITKSNLSKIISKLHSKKILSRIRVGKINKIYLGEKLKSEISNTKEKEEN